MKISVGDREVDFVANAATPIYFKRIFHKDLFAEMMSAGDSGDTESQFALAFVMAKQAEGHIRHTGHRRKHCALFQKIKICHSSICSISCRFEIIHLPAVRVSVTR